MKLTKEEWETIDDVIIKAGLIRVKQMRGIPLSDKTHDKTIEKILRNAIQTTM